MPQLILCSDTVRSRETVEALTLAEPLFSAARVSYLPSLYAASAMDGETTAHLRFALSAALAACGPVPPQTVMCVGHNRGWEEAASEFAGHSVELKTANAAVLEGAEAALSDSWTEALRAGVVWALRGVLTPETPSLA